MILWSKLPKSIRDAMPQSVAGQRIIGWYPDKLDDSEKMLLAQLMTQAQKEQEARLSQMDKLEMAKKILAQQGGV